MKKVFDAIKKFFDVKYLEFFLFIGFLILIIVIAIIVGPLFTIWALNTLFNLDIAYNFYNWLAASWILFVLNGHRMIEKGKNG